MQDYTRFSSLQIIVSLIGCVGGFVSIRHPDLAAAQPFWVSSISRTAYFDLRIKALCMIIYTVQFCYSQSKEMLFSYLFASTQHSSVVVAVIRALEFIWWSLLYLRSSPRLERWLQDARGWIADASAQAVCKTVAIARSATQTNREPSAMYNIMTGRLSDWPGMPCYSVPEYRIHAVTGYSVSSQFLFSVRKFTDWIDSSSELLLQTISGACKRDDTCRFMSSIFTNSRSCW